jgi:hypothetical protein
MNGPSGAMSCLPRHSLTKQRGAFSAMSRQDRLYDAELFMGNRTAQIFADFLSADFTD